jgi:hypothetical protein
MMKTSKLGIILSVSYLVLLGISIAYEHSIRIYDRGNSEFAGILSIALTSPTGVLLIWLADSWFGVKVLAEGMGKRYRSVSDEDRWFNYAVAKSGVYKVRMFLPHNIGVAGTSELLDKISDVVKTKRHYIVEYRGEVKASGCTFIDVPLFIFGRVADKDRAGS